MNGDMLIIDSNGRCELKKATKNFSACMQDLFVVECLNYIKNGYFVDIGSAHCYDYNNTFLLEKEYNWNGICIEFEPRYNSSYSARSCKYYNTDATAINYKELFQDNNSPNIIDYISLDIDEQTTNLLKILPFDTYKFKVITIEHDSYLNGDKEKDEQRKILKDKGYHLLFGDIFVEMNGFEKNKSFEDWWINSDFFESGYVERCTKNFLYPSDAIQVLKDNK